MRSADGGSGVGKSALVTRQQLKCECNRFGALMTRTTATCLRAYNVRLVDVRVATVDRSAARHVTATCHVTADGTVDQGTNSFQ